MDLHPYGPHGSCSHMVDEWGKATVTSSAQFASANYASVVLSLRLYKSQQPIKLREDRDATNARRDRPTLACTESELGATFVVVTNVRP